MSYVEWWLFLKILMGITEHKYLRKKYILVQFRQKLFQIFDFVSSLYFWNVSLFICFFQKEQQAEFFGQTSLPSSSAAPQFKDDTNTQCWLAGESQAVEGNDADESLLCDEIFGSYPGLDDPALNDGPFSAFARITDDSSWGWWKCILWSCWSRKPRTGYRSR